MRGIFLFNSVDLWLCPKLWLFVGGAPVESISRTLSTDMMLLWRILSLNKLLYASRSVCGFSRKCFKFKNQSHIRTLPNIRGSYCFNEKALFISIVFEPKLLFSPTLEAIALLGPRYPPLDTPLYDHHSTRVMEKYYF